MAAAAARESREREEAKRRDFERLVAEAADAMARSERDRLTGAAEVSVYLHTCIHTYSYILYMCVYVYTYMHTCIHA